MNRGISEQWDTYQRDNRTMGLLNYDYMIESIFLYYLNQGTFKQCPGLPMLPMILLCSVTLKQWTFEQLSFEKLEIITIGHINNGNFLH